MMPSPPGLFAEGARVEEAGGALDGAVGVSIFVRIPAGEAYEFVKLFTGSYLGSEG